MAILDFFEVLLQLASAVCAGFAAYFWYKSGKVDLGPGSKARQNANMASVLPVIAKLSKKAATWAAAAAAFAAVLSVLNLAQTYSS
jgi:hypothetical protein